MRSGEKISKEVVVAGENVWYNKISIIAAMTGSISGGRDTRKIPEGINTEG